MAATHAMFETTIVSPTSLSSQLWWPAAHAAINDAFLNKNYSVFPPTWTRLDPDPTKGAAGLAHELGHQGAFIVIFDGEGDPVACSGVLPFRGDNWINDESDPERGDARRVTHTISASQVTPPKVYTDWETCCFCVHPSHRGRGLAYRLLDELVALVKPRGAKRLVSNYAVDETGEFWPRLGFDVIPGAGGMLPKGFQTDPAKEGLRADVYFKMAAKAL